MGSGACNQEIFSLKKQQLLINYSLSAEMYTNFKICQKTRSNSHIIILHILTCFKYQNRLEGGS